MDEGYRLGAARASSSVQHELAAFVVPRRPRSSAGSATSPRETARRRSKTAAQVTDQKGDAMNAGTPSIQVDAVGVAPTLMLLLVLLLTALGVVAHAAFI
jgi:hypothetical protein